MRRVAAVGTYVIVRDGKSTFLRNNLGAYEIVEVSVAGPELTLRFLDTYHRLAFEGEDTGWRPGWSTYSVCEGGLLVDRDKQVLMMFTEHRDWRLCVAYLDTARRTWPGWDVRWAHDGISELARYAGLDTGGVEDPAHGSREDQFQLQLERSHGATAVGSVPCPEWWSLALAESVVGTWSFFRAGRTRWTCCAASCATRR